MSRRNPIQGPGKFEGELYLTREIYQNGWHDEEIGSVDELGWYGRFSGKIKGRGPFHIIIAEDNQGFVSGQLFKTPAEMKKAWTRIEKAYEEFYGEGEE